MKRYTLYNAKLGTCRRLSEEQMQEAKKFYGIDFPAWDEYYQRHDENSLHNARGDIFLWITDEQITLELKQKEKAEAFEKKWKAEVKSEAYREFAERVKLEFYYEFDELIPSIMSDRIDNLLKELVGEDDG